VSMTTGSKVFGAALAHHGSAIKQKGTIAIAHTYRHTYLL